MDAKRAGMGSGLMQMTFNIPAALGVALVTSIIGTLTASKVAPGLGSRTELRDIAAQYADAVQDGDMAGADELLTGLPQDSVDAIKEAVVGAASGRHHDVDAGALRRRTGRRDLRLDGDRPPPHSRQHRDDAGRGGLRPLQRQHLGDTRPAAPSSSASAVARASAISPVTGTTTCR